MKIIETIRTNRKILLYLFVAAFLLRALYLLTAMAVIDRQVLNRDYEYGVIARSQIAGNGYSVPLIEFGGNGEVIRQLNQYRPTANQLPVYPLLLAAVYHLADGADSRQMVMWIQAIIGSTTCLIICLIAIRLFDDIRIALVSGWAMALYPTFIIHVSVLVPEIVMTFWFSAMLLSLVTLRDNPSVRLSVMTGILLGISILASNVIVPIIPFILIWLVISLKMTSREKIRITFILLAAMSVVISPLLIRNYRVFNEFPLLKTTAGTNLWLGNNSQATGTFFLHTGELVSSILPKDFVHGHHLSETEQDRILYDQAMSFIKSDPQHFIRLFFVKLYYFLLFPPDHLLSRESVLLKKIVMIPYSIVFSGFLAGICLCLKKNPKEVFLLGGIVFSVALLYAIFIVGHPRYRMTIEPYMIIMASVAVKTGIDRLDLIKGKRAGK